MARILENTDAFVHVLGLDYCWLAINPAGAREFERVFGISPKVGDRLLDLLADQPDQWAGLRLSGRARSPARSSPRSPASAIPTPPAASTR